MDNDIWYAADLSEHSLTRRIDEKTNIDDGSMTILIARSSESLLADQSENLQCSSSPPLLAITHASFLSGYKLMVGQHINLKQTSHAVLVQDGPHEDKESRRHAATLAQHNAESSA